MEIKSNSQIRPNLCNHHNAIKSCVSNIVVRGLEMLDWMAQKQQHNNNYVTQLILSQYNHKYFHVRIFERLIPEVIPQPTIHTHEVTLLLCSRFTLGTKHNINHNPLISNLSKVLRLVLAGLSGCVWCPREDNWWIWCNLSVLVF